VDWRTLLRRYAGQELEVRPTFYRPPRRFPQLLGIVPGQARQASKPKIMAVIDTSGSITPALLSMIDAELRRLPKGNHVLVVECDCEIQREYSYRPLDLVCGRGGTDFRPPLARDFLRRHRPDLIIYFTDGWGPAPERPLSVPVLWIILPGGAPPAKWGRVIDIHTQEFAQVAEITGPGPKNYAFGPKNRH
jgi:predicted metal-dependent peptidase